MLIGISLMQLCKSFRHISAILSDADFLDYSNVVIRFVTILAPHDSPNTDGIDPGNFYLK